MKEVKGLLTLLVGGLVGCLPGLLVGFLAWVPLRLWLFSMIPADAQWAFWAKLVSCLLIVSTVGGSLPVWLMIVGTVFGLKAAAAIID